MQTSIADPANNLHEEQKVAGRLIAILQQEQACLIDANIEGLSALTEEKATAVTQLSELAKSRHNQLALIGFASSEAGMQEWLNSTNVNAAAEKSWTELLSLAKSAKELNLTNGLLINKHMAHNQNALNVLQINPQGGNFYGPDGQAAAKPGSRNLVIG